MKHKDEIAKLAKIAKIVEESSLLRDEIQQRIIKAEEEKQLEEIKKKFLLES